MASHVNKPALSPPTPCHRRRPLPPNYIGADPYDMIGKVLRTARQSSKHPSVILEFSDGTSFQILVDGYDPMHPGVPKELEIDSELHALFTSGQTLDLPIIGCTLITLLDKAFERKPESPAQELRWDQKHLGIALRFSEEAPRWRCIWATMEDRDSTGVCVFRSYSDIHLQKLRCPRANSRHGNKSKPRPRSESW